MNEHGALTPAELARETDAMQTAGAYCVCEKGEGTGMYQVETRIRRLLPF